MPSFQQLREPEERWRRLPGRERLAGPGSRVALTFDDGPDPDATPAVLEAAGAVATFFLVGEQVEAHPELARELAERGHAVAVHGQRHVEHDTLTDPRNDLERGRALVREATGREPELFRPPYGRFSEASHAACLALDLVPVYWSAWGADWEPVPAARIAELAIRDLAPGAIVLLHDSARYAQRASAAPTAAALPASLAAVRERGLELVGLSRSVQ